MWCCCIVERVKKRDDKMIEVDVRQSEELLLVKVI